MSPKFLLTVGVLAAASSSYISSVSAKKSKKRDRNAKLEEKAIRCDICRLGMEKLLDADKPDTINDKYLEELCEPKVGVGYD